MSLVRQIISKMNKGIPEVERPERAPTLKEKLAWTALALIVYYFLTQVPIYGAPRGGLDYLAQIRVIFAGAQGSIVELGIGPIVTAGIVLELLVGSKIVKLDLTDPDDRKFFQEAQRVAAIFFILFEVSAYTLGGRFGNLTTQQALIVIAQLSLGSFLLMMLDDLVAKWGIGSGISLFILAGVAQEAIWSMFSPKIEPTTKRYVGVIPALITEGVGAIYRGSLPGLVGLISTFVVFIAVIWAYEVRVNISIAHSLYGGLRTRYPIRLLYVSNVPIIFASALLGDIDILAKIAWSRLGSETSGWAKYLVDFLGRYEADPVSGSVVPVQGLAYYLATPHGPSVFVQDPIRAIVYILVLVASCVAFAKIWVMTAGMDPRTVSEQLVRQGIVVPGRRASAKVVAKTIEKYIEAVTYLGGIMVGLLAAVANFTGAFGTGSGILLAVTIIAGLYERLAQERTLEMYPRLKRFIR
ncbi:MAG: preprotein translocase subunit SecY [Candidatus Korarchaeum sp.]|jgi:preprotein translocase SecY subunit|nr:preprotein translocase subunit SecY [Candidatus Korarchaeum sp.]